ncbi:MAG TPA: lysylphosphatidylglycerol synthase domain-containing protein, partial [Blastocatellia bacterium]|nr:lysylphosphatidylglycerol synthase domain-containing protein [Blastocatellia bacterium]
MNQRRSQLISLAMLVVGIGLLVFLLKQTGLSEIIARVKILGWGFLILLVLSGLRVVLRAWSWIRCMPESERAVGFWPVWRARVVGDAAGQLTTAGPIISEPIRVKSLHGGLSLHSRVSSLTIETLTYMISCCLMIVVGLVALVAQFALSQNMRNISMLAAGLTLLIVIFTCIVVRQRWHLASILGGMAIRGLHYLGLGRKFDHRLHQLQMLEAHVFDFYAERPMDFLLVAICHTLFHLVGAAETYATLVLTGFQSTFLAAFTLEATNRVVNMLFSFVPGRVGVDEAGSGLLAQTLGLGSSAGIALALIRKARVLFWTVLGLLLFIQMRWS